jgi:CheY-like chemotaxis protein
MSDQHSIVNGRLRVLVVEDEWLVADYIVDVLEEAGHEVVATAATGEKALEYLDRTMVDIAILDVKLKGRLSGIDVAHASRTRAIPHVFITGSGDPATRAAAEATGPLGFLQKPFSRGTLVAVLDGMAEVKRPDASPDGQREAI